MSGSDRQTDRIVRAWLEDGVTVFPDRLLDDVLGQLPDTRQRQPSWLTGRFAQMNASMRVALAVAAVVVVVAGGAYLFAGRNAGAPVATPTPTLTATQTPVPTASPLAYPDQIPFNEVVLDAGSYSYYESMGYRELRVTFTVPAGWISNESWYVYRESTDPENGGGVAVSPWLNKVNIIYDDPCQHDIMMSTGSTVAELVAAFVDTSMYDGAEPVDITVSGYAGKEIRISTDPTIDDTTCRGESIIPWIAAPGGSERHVFVPGTEQTLWILDVEGARLVIDASAEPGADATQRAELQQILESIQIEVS